jgi:hypothetical protein
VFPTLARRAHAWSPRGQNRSRTECIIADASGDFAHPTGADL